MGNAYKDCKGPSFGSEKMSLVDFPASEAVGVEHVIKPDFGGDLPRNLDIPEFEFDEYGVSRPTGLNPPVDELSDCDNDDDDEEARLRNRLKQLQIEKRACLREKRIADLKRMVQEEERQLDDLKHLHDDAECENCQQHVRFATSAVSGHAVNSTKSVTTKTLKKLSKSMNFTPLDTLLGSAGTGGESVSQNSGMGLNLGGRCFQSFLPSSQSEHSVPVLGAAEGREKQSFPSCTDLPDRANILLQPKSSSNC